MKSIILAAGRGTRIYPVTHGLPKCLLSFGRQTILDAQIESLFRLGLTDLAIVVGYNKDQIICHVERRHPDKLKHIEFITNPDFASTNNMYSLWLAREWLGETSFLCLNGDVLCHPDILLPAVATRADISVVIDREFREETTKVIIRNGRVVMMKKGISRQDFNGTFLGIATFSRRGTKMLFAQAESEFAEGQVNQFFNDAISHLATKGVRVDFTETGGLPWAEVDDANDWLFAQTQVYPHLGSALASRGATDEGAGRDPGLPAVRLPEPLWQPLPD